MMYEYWLARVHPLSNQKKQKLRACIGSAKEIYYIEETQIYQLDFLTKKDQAVLAEAKKELRLEETYRALEEHGIRFLPYFDKEYPGRLRKALSPPYALYVKGRLPEEEKVSVAIVGARNVLLTVKRWHLCTERGLQKQESRLSAAWQEGLTERHREGR